MSPISPTTELRVTHGLSNEGAPFLIDGCDHFNPNCAALAANMSPRRGGFGGGTSGSGHALCACGDTSGHLESGAARQRWHRQHKADVLAAA